MFLAIMPGCVECSCVVHVAYPCQRSEVTVTGRT